MKKTVSINVLLLGSLCCVGCSGGGSDNSGNDVVSFASISERALFSEWVATREEAYSGTGELIHVRNTSIDLEQNTKTTTRVIEFEGGDEFLEIELGIESEEITTETHTTTDHYDDEGRLIFRRFLFISETRENPTAPRTLTHSEEETYTFTYDGLRPINVLSTTESISLEFDLSHSAECQFSFEYDEGDRVIAAARVDGIDHVPVWNRVYTDFGWENQYFREDFTPRLAVYTNNNGLVERLESSEIDGSLRQLAEYDYDDQGRLLQFSDFGSGGGVSFRADYSEYENIGKPWFNSTQAFHQYGMFISCQDF